MAYEPRRRDDHGDAFTLAPGTQAELKRVTVLFLLSSITVVLILAYVVARTILLRALELAVVPDIGWVMWAVSMMCGFIATWVYGTYVTARARRWLWVALCALPPTAVPCSLAYAWVRRGELETEIVTQRERAAR